MQPKQCFDTYKARASPKTMNTLKHIQSGDIHVWICYPEQIKDTLLLKQYKNLLTEEEITRQQRYRFAKDQHNALITRAFVRDVLSQYADIAAKDWRFSKGEKDKPEIINPPIPLRFNLSHTEGMIICDVLLMGRLASFSKVQGDRFGVAQN